MTHSKGKQQRNLVFIVAIAAFLLVGVLFFSGYNPFATKASTSGTLIIVNYSDGTLPTRYDSAHPDQNKALNIYSNGHPVQSIQVELYITPVFSGTVTSYTAANTNLFFSIQDFNGNTLYTSGAVPLQSFNPLPTLTSGKSTVLVSSTISATTLQNLYSGWSNGPVYKVVLDTGAISLTLNLVDSTTGASNSYTQTAMAPEASWNFQWGGTSFSSLGITFQTNAT